MDIESSQLSSPHPQRFIDSEINIQKLYRSRDQEVVLEDLKSKLKLASDSFDDISTNVDTLNQTLAGHFISSGPTN